MLKGKSLGDAIRTALESKGLGKPALAAKHWKIRPPSVNGWFSTGRISTDRLLDVMDLCSDKYGPDFWGLDHWPGAGSLRQGEAPPYNVTPLPSPTDEVTEKIMELLQKTDSIGRAMALGAVKVALHGHVLKKANHAK